jgi:uncharacterized protein
MDWEPLQIIDHFYPESDPAKAILLRHSTQVMEKALAILENSPYAGSLDREVIRAGALLHDIGIGKCHAPGIGCFGTLPYIAHGITGAAMLRELSPELEVFARICERHTGTGLTVADIKAQQLPLPEQEFLPETPEEKLVCLADKFFSKSADMKEKPLEKVRSSIAAFGSENSARFAELCREFGVK